MVGIPGKSKGCHTCRRRKIKCDLQRPSCVRCMQSGRVCEGYKRGPVFLNRTAQGWQKRSRLEEVLPRHDAPQVPPGDDLRTFQQQSQSRPELYRALYRPPLQVNPSSAIKAQFQNIFIESYLPSNPKVGPGLTQVWLWEAIRVNNPGKALEYSLRALCVSRVGRINRDQDLILKGNATYGLALKALHRSLESQELAGKDDTLAACLILSIYELFESTTNSTEGHENHISGIERLVAWRGPGQHSSPLAKALLKNVVYTSMVKGLQYRKASIIKDLIDKTQWWDIQGELFAKGHTLAALLETLDRSMNSGEVDAAAAAKYIEQCCELDSDFQNWYRQLLKESPSPMYWKSGPSGKEPEILFASLYHAHLMLDFWALRLALSTTIDIICSRAPKEIPLPTRNTVEHLKNEHGSSRQINLATDIMLSLQYCMNDEYGLASSQKCLFSGRVALYALRRYPSEQLASYEAKFLDLTLKKGLRYAQDISKGMRSSWTAVVAERGPLQQSSDAN